MKKVFDRLANYEIYPEGAFEENNSLESQRKELKERVIRWAAEIRRSWDEEAKRSPILEPWLSTS